MRSDALRNMVAAHTGIPGENLLLKVDSVSAAIMEQLIMFIYTDTCDYLQVVVLCFIVICPVFPSLTVLCYKVSASGHYLNVKSDVTTLQRIEKNRCGQAHIQHHEDKCWYSEI